MDEAPALPPMQAAQAQTTDSQPHQEAEPQIKQDIRHLSETIGPRGSTTEEEAKAAHYVAVRLEALGLGPQRQEFFGAASAYAPYALATFMALLSLFLFWQAIAIVTIFAIVLTAVTLAALWRELSFKDNVLRWVLYKDPSQNVIAKIAKRGDEARDDIVITTHLDTHRTPIIFSSLAWLKLFQWLLPEWRVSFAVLLAMFVIELFTGFAALRWMALVPGAVLLVIFALMLQADATPFTKGANDNASGVAVGLALASRLAQSPLCHHNVTLVFTGCEETGCYGADAFFRQHKAALRNPIHITIDQVGGAGTDPCILRSAQFLQTAHSDPALLKLADEVMAAHPELNAHSRSARGAYSELNIGMLHGVRAIGLFGIARDGAVPHWHQPTDTIETVEVDATTRATELAWHFLQVVDKQA
ncbi:MAG: Zn-dependent exopeptidase M28 [Anaerolineae bacterium]|nr:Zn-dependent exopeptidase M28 [Anaerolineae bacterium]